MSQDEKPASEPEEYGLPLMSEEAFNAGNVPLSIRVIRQVLGRLPDSPRCRACHAPISGFGAPIVRTFLRRWPSNYSLHFCNQCE
jgi:hypothetical protein